MHLFAHKRGVVEALPLLNELVEGLPSGKTAGFVWEMLQSVYNNSLNPHTENFNLYGYMYTCALNEQRGSSSPERQFVYIIENKIWGEREPFTVSSDEVSGELARAGGDPESERRDMERRFDLEALLTHEEDFYKKGYLLKRLIIMATKGYKTAENVLREYSRRNRGFEIDLLNVLESWDSEELIEELKC